MDEDDGSVDAERDADEVARKTNFLTDIVDADLAAGRCKRVVTRFPPEPNGFLHIGHAKAIGVNHGLATAYDGLFRLRFDDTNPLTEDARFVEAISADIAWLGCAWEPPVRHASDYFDFIYASAQTLVRKGLAYVDDQSKADLATSRGTITEPGVNSPFRERSPEENLDLLGRMKAGEFEDGSRVLRAKIDMSAADMLLRDPLLYRIRHVTHHRTGDTWCIYPMYDFAHCLEDAYEEVTHSLCSLEFETRRGIYDWVLDNTLEGEALAKRPHQYEFARLNIEYTVTSKRKLAELVNDGHVSGWDDPRMPTIAGLRRRGVTAEAIRAFIDLVGISKTNSLVDIGKFDYCLREDLSPRSPRVMCVLDPLEVVITTWHPEDSEEIEAPYWPHDIPKEASRTIFFERRIYIDRGDFSEDPPKGWHRLAPGGEVRLRHAYVIRVNEVEKDGEGNIVRLLCSHDPATRFGQVDGRKVKGTIHWVSASHSVACEVRLYDRLFAAAAPGAERDFKLDLNPDSLAVVQGARVEDSVAADGPQSRYQFERVGYFIPDSEDSAPSALVFNRVVSLRDTWGKKTGAVARAAPRATKQRAPQVSGPQTTIADERVRARAANPVLAAAFARYTADLRLTEEDSDRLTGDANLVAFVDAAIAVHDDGPAVAKWAINELLRELKERPLGELPFSGAAFGALVALVEAGEISAAAGKDVFSEMIADGGEPAAIVERRGLRQVSDTDALGAIVDSVIDANADKVALYRGGKTGLLGFFMGQVMRASQGKANPGLVNTLLTEKLGGVEGVQEK